MFNIFKNVIESRTYELNDMIKKINTNWVQGTITDNEKDELINLAQSKAKIENSIDILAKLDDHERRIKALESLLETKDEDVEEGTEGTDEEPTEPTYEEFVVGKWYYAGDKISFDGVNYVCVAPEGVVCVWNPNDYPTYWEVIE